MIWILAIKKKSAFCSDMISPPPPCINELKHAVEPLRSLLDGKGGICH